MFDLVKVFGVLILSFSTVKLVFCYFDNHEEDRPIYLTASVGAYIIFNCDIDFPETMPIPYKIIWKKDNKTIFTYFNGISTSQDPYVGRINLLNDVHQIYDRASINLTSVRDTDTGWFVCKIVFPNRTPSTRNNGTWFHLTVNGGNLLAIPPLNLTVLEGDEATFLCLPKDLDLKVRWYKNGLLLKEYQELVNRCLISSDGTLTINPTDMGDSGEYECEVTHYDTGDRQSGRAILDVQYKAKVVYVPPEIQLPYGKPAIIDCNYNANPPLKNIKWEKDGFLYDPYNVQGVFYMKNGSLHILKVDENHNGLYTCTPYNELGTQGPSPVMVVNVQRPPVFVVAPQHLYIKKLGEPIDIPCNARDEHNQHRPIVVWYKKDGTSLPLGRYTIQDGTLSIINIQEEDRGLYVCSAENKAATITAETELLVEKIPSSAPYNLTGISSSRTVYLRWQAGRQRANVNYSIWYRPVASPDFKTYEVPSFPYLEATIDNLDPSREYEFMVLCKDQIGEGIFSKAIRLYTKPLDGLEFSSTRKNFLPPIGYPRNVNITPTYNGYLVKWDTPIHGREFLKYYIVRWTQGPDHYFYGSMDTKENSYLLTDLPGGSQYNIQVIAVTDDEQQAVSETVTIDVPEFKRVQAVSTGIIAGLAFLVVIFVAVYYAKKKWYKKNQHQNKNKFNSIKKVSFG